MLPNQLYTALLALGHKHRFRVGLGARSRINPHLPPHVALYSNEDGQWQVTFAGGSHEQDYTVDTAWATPEKLLEDLQPAAFHARDSLPGVEMLRHETVVDMTTVGEESILCTYCKGYAPRKSAWIHYNGQCDFYLCEECSEADDGEDPLPTLLLRDGEFIPTGEYDAQIRERMEERERRRQAEIAADREAEAFQDRQHPSAPHLQVLKGGRDGHCE